MDSLRSVQPSKMNSRKLLAVSTFNFTKRLNVKVKAQLEEQVSSYIRPKKECEEAMAVAFSARDEFRKIVKERVRRAREAQTNEAARQLEEERGVKDGAAAVTNDLLADKDNRRKKRLSQSGATS